MPRKNRNPKARKTRSLLKEKMTAEAKFVAKCRPLREDPHHGDQMKIAALAAIYLSGNKK